MRMKFNIKKRNLFDKLALPQFTGSSEKFQFAKKLIENIRDLGDQPKTIDYINFGFQLKEDYDACFNSKDPFCRFSSKKDWERISDSSIIDIIYDVLRPHIKKSKIINSNGSIESFETTIENVKFAFITSSVRIEQAFVAANQAQSFKDLFKKLFWEKYDLSVSFDLDIEDKLSITNDKDRNNTLKSSLAERTSEEIKKYLDKGFGRSLLFYGPPGSGKSCLVKQIALQLGFRTLRINDIHACGSTTLIELIDLIGAEIIILEDIDSIRVEDLSDVLRKIEKMNSNKRVILATVNKVINLDNALVRPERFDEAVEVSKLDKHIIMNIINNDDEIYEIVKNYPATFVSEVGKRLKVLGKEQTLLNINDLKDRFANLGRDSYKLLDDLEDE